MIIWFAFAIPVTFVLIDLIFFRRKVVWWEFILQFMIPAVLIMTFKFTVEMTQVHDTEYWGGWVTKAEYYEYWDEWIVAICYREVACGIDANGNTIYRQEAYDCSHAEYHQPYWLIYDSNGEFLKVDEWQYRKLAKQFGIRPNFVDMDRNFWHTDGDMYRLTWNGNPHTLEPVVTEHSYVNKVAVSNSVFNFKKVDKETVAKYKLYDYPKINHVYELPCILGDGGSTTAAGEKKFQYLNATLGAEKQVRLWVCIFRDLPIQAGFFQENYWKGGNKNEFILTIGVNDNNRITWCHPISWTEQEILKVEARDYVASQDTLDLVAIADWLGPKVQTKFIRKPFADFDYLTVEPPTWAVIVTYVTTLVVTVLICLFVVNNMVTERSQRRRRRDFYKY